MANKIYTELTRWISGTIDVFEVQNTIVVQVQNVIDFETHYNTSELDRMYRFGVQDVVCQVLSEYITQLEKYIEEN